MSLRTTYRLGKNLVDCQGWRATIGCSRMLSSLSSHLYETLTVTQSADHVYHVQLNRPDKRNALNIEMWKEIPQCFDDLGKDSACRAIVLSGAGKSFCAGIDLFTLSGLADDSLEVARKAMAFHRVITEFQNTFNAIEKCPKPVIAAVHGVCIGAGVGMISACDIRLCSEDASFSVKEVDRGLAADIGTLQRFPKIIGNDSLSRELIYTARNFSAIEAKSIGFVSSVHPDIESTVKSSLKIADTIASRSPVAVMGSKVNLNYSRNHSTEDGLNHVAIWNMCMVQSEDLIKSIEAAMTKTTPKFNDL